MATNAKTFVIRIYYIITHSVKTDERRPRKHLTRNIKEEFVILDILFKKRDAAFDFAEGFNESTAYDDCMPDEKKEENPHFTRGWIFRWKLNRFLSKWEIRLESVPWAKVLGTTKRSKSLCEQLWANKRRRKMK